MRRPAYTTRFHKDLKKAIKRGKDLDKLKAVSRTLVAGEPLEARFRDHPLVGNYESRRECHIEPPDYPHVALQQNN